MMARKLKPGEIGSANPPPPRSTVNVTDLRPVAGSRLHKLCSRVVPQQADDWKKLRPRQ